MENGGKSFKYVIPSLSKSSNCRSQFQLGNSVVPLKFCYLLHFCYGSRYHIRLIGTPNGNLIKGRALISHPLITPGVRRKALSF